MAIKITPPNLCTLCTTLSHHSEALFAALFWQPHSSKSPSSTFCYPCFTKWKHFPFIFIPPEQSEGGSLEFSLWFFCIGIMGKWGDVTCPSVTSFSAHTSGARGLKFDRNNHHIGGSKFTAQILISCLEAEIFKFKVMQ